MPSTSTTSEFGYFPAYSGVTAQGLNMASMPSPGAVAPVTLSGALESATQMTAAQILSGMILHDPEGNVNAQFPDAADLIKGMGGSSAGKGVRYTHRNTANGAETITVTVGTGVTLDSSATATIAQNNQKDFLLVVTGPAAYTVYSLGTAAF